MTDSIALYKLAEDSDRLGRSDHADAFRAAGRRIEAEALEIARLRAEVEKEQVDALRVIAERDRAQDALQEAHIALGGDGEWTTRIGSAAEPPPHSGDLHEDVPVLAKMVHEELGWRHEELAQLRKEVGILKAASDMADAVMLPLQEERNAARAESARLRTWVSDLQSGMYVNCVYCGHRYGPGETTPVSMADALKAHVEECPDHPMSKLKAEVARLREALEWYADPEIYKPHPHGPGFDDRDLSYHARAALRGQQ